MVPETIAISHHPLFSPVSTRIISHRTISNRRRPGQTTICVSYSLFPVAPEVRDHGGAEPGRQPGAVHEHPHSAAAQREECGLGAGEEGRAENQEEKKGNLWK